MTKLTGEHAKHIRIDGDVAYVELTRGKVAVIDASDAERISYYKWYYNRSNGAVASFMIGLLARFIMSAPFDMFIDHINGDKLNNRKDNLRLATRSQNAQNRQKKAATSSTYKGVERKSRVNGFKWKAGIEANGNRIHLGFFDTELEAAIAYNEAAIKYHGDFAKLNEIK